MADQEQFEPWDIVFTKRHCNGHEHKDEPLVLFILTEGSDGAGSEPQARAINLLTGEGDVVFLNHFTKGER